ACVPARSARPSCAPSPRSAMPGAPPAPRPSATAIFPACASSPPWRRLSRATLGNPPVTVHRIHTMSAAIRLKQLQEQRGTKLKEASALSTASTKENRSLTSEELSKIEALRGEVDTIDRTVTVEVRQVALESQAAQQ